MKSYYHQLIWYGSNIKPSNESAPGKLSCVTVPICPGGILCSNFNLKQFLHCLVCLFLKRLLTFITQKASISHAIIIIKERIMVVQNIKKCCGFSCSQVIDLFQSFVFFNQVKKTGKVFQYSSLLTHFTFKTLPKNCIQSQQHLLRN